LPFRPPGRKNATQAALRGDVRPTSRPNLDNFVKSALDAINTIVVADDCQIVELTARKRFSADGDGVSAAGRPMGRLDASAVEHLCKLLGLLGSAHDGERDAAAWKAHEFLNRHGLT
jgi:hypothetical protein